MRAASRLFLENKENKKCVTNAATTTKKCHWFSSIGLSVNNWKTIPLTLLSNTRRRARTQILKIKDSFLCTLRKLRGKAGRLKNFSYSSLPRIHFPCHTYIRMLFVLTVGLQKTKRLRHVIQTRTWLTTHTQSFLKIVSKICTAFWIYQCRV